MTPMEARLSRWHHEAVAELEKLRAGLQKISDHGREGGGEWAAGLADDVLHDAKTASEPMNTPPTWPAGEDHQMLVDLVHEEHFWAKLGGEFGNERKALKRMLENDIVDSLRNELKDLKVHLANVHRERDAAIELGAKFESYLKLSNATAVRRREERDKFKKLAAETSTLFEAAHQNTIALQQEQERLYGEIEAAEAARARAEDHHAYWEKLYRDLTVELEQLRGKLRAVAEDQREKTTQACVRAIRHSQQTTDQCREEVGVAGRTSALAYEEK